MEGEAIDLHAGASKISRTANAHDEFVRACELKLCRRRAERDIAVSKGLWMKQSADQDHAVRDSDCDMKSRQVGIEDDDIECSRGKNPHPSTEHDHAVRDRFDPVAADLIRRDAAESEANRGWSLKRHGENAHDVVNRTCEP